MIRISILHSTALALALPLAAPAFAQSEVVAAPNPDADRLAGQIRRLATDPRNVTALLDAGDLSARLGDTSAALAFFARAEALDRNNPRIAAGRAVTLVRLQRPGEALRLFQSAQAAGLSPVDYASDRGLAYDLLGQPELAQNEYRTALGKFRDDETVRRYALSLGITGNVNQAMQELDPLVRRSDRAAWRARAFVLAMNGDVAGADKIATTMMPGNLGSSLSPFFRRLEALDPGDRAFAVHFGELSKTQARIADARLAPAMPRYTPRPPEVAVAARAPTPQRGSGGRQQTAARSDTPSPAPSRPSRGTRIQETRPQPTPTPAPAPSVASPSAVAAVQTPLPTPAPTQARAPASVEQNPVRVAGPVQSRTNAPAAPTRARNDVVAPVRQPSPPTAIATRTEETAVSNARSEPPRAVAQTVTPAPFTAPAPTPAPAPAPASRIGAEDSVLSSIISQITIPAAELEAVNRIPVDPPRAVAQAPTVAAARAVEASAAARAVEAPPVAAPKPAPKAEPKPAPKPVAKPAPKKPVVPAEPARIWVQVAGGANLADLPKAWNANKAKAPALFSGKSAWTMPIRATNRLLVGPFKTSAEAQSFVNGLSREGLSGFVVNSEAGQKVTRLPVK